MGTLRVMDACAKTADVRSEKSVFLTPCDGEKLPDIRALWSAMSAVKSSLKNTTSYCFSFPDRQEVQHAGVIRNNKQFAAAQLPREAPSR